MGGAWGGGGGGEFGVCVCVCVCFFFFFGGGGGVGVANLKQRVSCQSDLEVQGTVLITPNFTCTYKPPKSPK